jgi:hypothetical protein
MTSTSPGAATSPAADYQTLIRFEAAAGAVFDALTTIDGLAS